MVTLAKARQMALALPEATEQDHHGMNSFRVRNKIFATVPDGHHVRVMVDEPEILAAAEDPSSCEPFCWGKRLACVVVNLRTVQVDLLGELLTEAWLRKSPKSLARTLLDRG